jgi:glucose/arabinose dehydrogenase
LWITESGGKVSRVDPVSGAKTVVYTAPDYFAGSAAEKSTLCFQPMIGVGTLGMALHPDFMSGSPYIYFVYSYNSGSPQAPVTKFKIERLTWNSTSHSVTSNTTVVSLMPTGYDHLGGRLMIIKQNGTPYLFFTVGDNGISEANDPGCYSPQSNNPNNFAQDPSYKNGKIHRFNVDGTVPSDNPIAGNSFYTRGHRNPQGLMYNPGQNIIYDVEHGDRSDDEINVLLPGMNYGWKYVRGFHNDNNFPGEANFVATYTPHAQIANDALKEPLYAWCSVPQSTTVNANDWCTVAPSDGIYYGSTGIPEWTNSLLVVTLKNGNYSDIGVYQLKLSANGLGPDPLVSPNPHLLFSEDQAQNGRLRDIAVSPDGTKIYLINNGGATNDKITVYTYQPPASIQTSTLNAFSIQLSPSPLDGAALQITCSEKLVDVELSDLYGKVVCSANGNGTTGSLLLPELTPGVYICHIRTESGKTIKKKIVKDR